MIEGLANTGRVITSAALIMVCVFTSFVLSGDPVVKQFGIGLAVAIAIDATIVRCLLVPAVMTLLGRRVLVDAAPDGALDAADLDRGPGLLRARGRPLISPSQIRTRSHSCTTDPDADRRHDVRPEGRPADRRPWFPATRTGSPASGTRRRSSPTSRRTSRRPPSCGASRASSARCRS